ncbi:SDR family NAD(P)-dependent oxidoreductase [Kitasatospora sp. NPDC101176]|uniref:SDR family NAD(P)-dependent oxidoreductase n=1 Tax=Kitasatospora sp. NPDC101176 TaxID=3364099 RepID=UPI0037F6D7C8
MSFDGSVVVITGAASGIGAGLARRFAQEGSRLVLADRDAGRIREIADELSAVGVTADVSTDEGVRSIVDRAVAEFGGVDVFCGNAGIGGARTPADPDDAWQRTFDVNVMAHVRAARILLPQWLSRGSGRFVFTVSGAGLLSMPGGAGYSVTKHAAQAFTEWLAYTYAHRGIAVHAVCPEGVRTPMLDSDPYAELVLEPTAITVDEVVDAVMGGIRAERFLILPNQGTDRKYAARAIHTDEWLAAMSGIEQRVQQTLADRQG